MALGRKEGEKFVEWMWRVANRTIDLDWLPLTKTALLKGWRAGPEES